MAKKQSPAYLSQPSGFDFAAGDRFIASLQQSTPPEPEKRTWGQAVGDTVVQLAEGVNTTLGAVPSIVAPDGAMAGFFRDNAEYWRDKQSDVLKKRIAATDQRIQEAGKEGVMSQIGTAAAEYWNDPAQAARLVATNLPSMAATLGTGALAGATAKGVAAARGLDAANKAALAAQYGTRTAMATNAALNAGGARGEAYEDLKRAALAQGMSAEQAEQVALDGSIMPGVVGGVAGAVSGKLGLEKALLGQTGAGAGTALRRAAGSFGAELAGEQIEEVAPKITTNYEAWKIDPARSLTDDLGRTMVETTIGAGPGALVAGGVGGMNTPAQAAADAIRATETVPESGPMTRASNAATEAKAQAVEAGAPLVDEQATAEPMPKPVDDPVRDQILALPDGARQDALRAYAVVNRTDVAKGVQQYNRKLLDRLLTENAPPPVLGESLTGTDMGAMLGGGGMTGNADPLAGALGMGREAQANSITNVANVAERRPPMPASDAARMLDEARNRGLDLAVAEHPAGGFVLVPPNWVTPDMAAQGEARLNETIARMQQADAAPVERAPRARTDGVGLNLQTDPVQNYLDNLRGVNTPAARAYVRDFDAGRLTLADVQRRIQAEQGLTPDQRIARAAAESPAQTDPVADRLARAAAQGMATPAPTDILNPAGEPFKTRMAADRAAKKTPGAVVPVEGGFVVRPQEPVNVQDVPQAPEVPQAAPVVSQPAQAPQAVGAQPAGPAAGVPAEGAGAVEAAGLTENKVGRKDSAQIAQPENVVSEAGNSSAQPAAPIRIGRDNTPLSEGGKPFKTRKAAGDAKKLQPMMRVVTVPGGYALAEKTPAQLAAEERASRRLRNPNTSAPGEPIPAHAFIAAAGGLSRVAAADIGVDGNPRIGNRTLFAGQGRGLSMEQATQMLIQDGYLSEGASINDALALIKTSLARPQYNADGIERIAKAEVQAQFEDYLAAQEESSAEGDADPFGMANEFTAEELDEVGYTDADPALQAEVAALITQAEAIGIDTFAILEDIARTYANATQDQYNAAARDALAQAIARSNQDGGSTAAQAAPASESSAEQGLNQPESLGQQAPAATENVAPAVSTTVDMPPTRQQESSPFARFATGRYRISIRDEGNGPYAEVVAIQRGNGVEIEMRMPGEALGHPAFSQLNARAQALFETPTSNMFDAEPGTLELESLAPAEAAAQQAAQEQAAKAETARQRAADAQAARDEERKRIAQASVRAAAEFELGQDPMDSLTGQGSMFDAPEQATEDNYLETLFGAGASDQPSAPQGGASKRKIDANKIAPALRKLADQKQAEADDWAGRVYRNNTTQIDLRGDGPSRQDSMSTNSVNESRRRRAVEALTQQANAASKLADRVENGAIDLQARLDSISDTVDSDMRRDGGKPMIGSSRADMFEGYISNNLLGDDNYGHGQGTVARMLREAYEGQEQPAPQPITRADVEDAKQQARADNRKKVETKEDDTGNVAMFSRTGAQSANANESTSRAWYDRFVSLLPESYRNDPHRREPLPAEDWNVQRAAEVRGKVELLNKQLRGKNDRKGYGPISIDGLGNLQVSALDVSVDDLDGPIKALANELGAGIAVTKVRAAGIQALQRKGFVAEISLAPVADRIMGREFVTPANAYAADAGAQGAIMTYKPRGFPAVLFARDTAIPPADSNARNAATQLLVDGLKAKWNRAPEIIVARNMQDAQIPQRVRDHDALLKSQGATGEARGFIYQGKVYLLSDQLNGARDVAEVLFHEVLGHYGLRGAFGDALTPILKQIAALRRADVQAKAKEYGLDMANEKQRLEAAEEVLAELSQVRPDIGFVKRAIAVIRTWLRENVPYFNNLKLTDAEIVNNYIIPARGFVERGAAPKQGNRQAVSMQRSRDGALRGVKDLADFLQRPAFGQQGLRSLKVPEQRVVLAAVADTIHDLQIFDDVVQLVPVDVMNKLFGTQGAAERLLNNPSMLQNLAAIDRENSIPLPVDAATAFVRATAFVAAKRLAATSQGGLSGKGLPAVDAFKRDLAASVSAEASVAAKGKAALAELSRLAGERLAAASAGKIQDRHFVTPTSDGVLGTGDVGASSVPPILSGDAALSRTTQTLPARGFVTRSKETGAQSLERAMGAFSRAPVADQTDTPAFKKWFGASQVVDADGKPLVVYHGTNVGINEFKPAKGLRSAGGLFESSATSPFKFFSPDKEEAQSYANAKGGHLLFSVYLRMERPLDSTTPDGLARMHRLFGSLDDTELSDWADSAVDLLDGIDELRATTPAEKSYFIKRDAKGRVIGQRATEREGYILEKYTAEDHAAEIERDLAQLIVEYEALLSAVPSSDAPLSVWAALDEPDSGDRLRAAGFDGLVFHENDGKKTFAVLDSTQIKSATGNNGDFDPANADIRFSRTTAQSIASSMGDMTPGQEQAYKNVAGVKAVPTVRERMDALKANLGLKLRQGLVDQFAAIKQLDQNAYVQARMSKGTDGTLEAMLMYGKPFMRDGAPDVDVKDGGFAKVLASLKGEQDRWMMWIAAQRAEKLKAGGKENLMTDDDISALKTLNAGKMADGTARMPIYAKALAELNEYNDAMLKLAMDSGLIDQAAYDLMAGQPYVPFYRLMEDGDMKGPKFSSGLTNQKAWQKLKGGSQQLNADLLQNMLLNWSHLLQASAKNRAATATMDAAEKMAVAYKVAADTKGAVKVMRDGSAEHWMVEDPYLLDAISAIHYVPSPLMKPLAKFKQLLTWGVTVNPTFKIRNLIRDSVSAIAQSELGYNPAANVAKGWKLTAKDSQIYASMLASGGLIKFGTQENTDRLRAQVAKLGGVMLDKGGAERFFGQIKDLYDVYNEFGDRAENVNRAALYDALIKKGKTHAEAAFMARDLMDFSMGGSAPVVRFLTQTVPFLNARLVGLDKLGRAAMEDPRRFAAVTGAVALASLALMAGYSDDEDWKKREDWDRDAYWWFKIGGQAYRIPKPFEVGAIGTLAERTAELMLSDEMTGKRYMERVSHMLSGTFSFNPVPQAFKPLLDLYANKDSFTGRAIESQADQRLRPQDRYSERTPEVAKFLGGLGLPDPAQLVKGEYSALSPKQVEHLIRGYFSWVGTAAMTVSDFGLRPLADRGERPDMRLKDVFIAGNFVENLPTGSSRYVTQMYEQSRQIEQAYASYQEAIKAGDMEKAQSIKESAGPLLRNRPDYTAATRQLAEINRTAKRIEADQAMAGAAKRARLTELENRRHVIAQRLSRMAATP